MMLTKPLDICGPCPLFGDGQGFSRPEGSGSLGVLLVGEALGRSERRDSLPFRPDAEAGSVLERAIKRAGFTRDQFGIWNVVACQPPDNKLEGMEYEDEAIEHCRSHFARVVERYRPKVIVALGGVALRALTGQGGARGRTVTDLRGYLLDGEYCPVLPSFHPSHLRRGAMYLLGVLIHDIQKAVQIARDGLDDYILNPEFAVLPGYNEDPSLDDARSFYYRVADSNRGLLTYDIEHPKSEEEESIGSEDDVSPITDPEGKSIYSIQFSLEPGTGIIFPWYGEYIEIATKILALPIEKAGHNVWKSDNPRLARNGIVVAGPVHDTMWAWHCLQPDLFMRLQFVASFYGMSFPWKHLKDQFPKRYGIADVDTPQRILEREHGGEYRLFADLKARWIWRSYERHVERMEQILAAMSGRGIPVSEDARKALKQTLLDRQKEIDATIQGLVPDVLRIRHPKEGYKRVPAVVAQAINEHGGEKPDFTICKTPVGQVEMFGETLDSTISLEAPPPEVSSPDVNESLADYIHRKTGMILQHFPTNGFGPAFPIDTVERWCRLEPFKPGSSKQVLAYMRHKRHRVPMMKGRDETSTKRELERLAARTGDKLYSHIVEWRETDKLLGTYVEGWAPDRDGRVHSTFTYGPATGQLASRGPNVQNAPRRVALAKAFRRMIEARPGHKLVEFDYKSFHALILGFEARDPAYMRLARADIHSFLASHLVKQPVPIDLPDDELKERLAWIRERYRSVRDNRAKPAILAWGFGQRWKDFYESNRESFDRPKDAKYVIDMIEDVFAPEVEYRRNVCDVAHRQSFLRSRHGSIRWFWDVYHWDAKRRTTVPGENYNEVISYFVQNDAFGHKKDTMIELDEGGWNERAGLINEIHDSLLFEIPDAIHDEAVEQIWKTMTKPSEILVDPIVAPTGLVCGVDVKVGRNWAEMEEVRVG